MHACSSASANASADVLLSAVTLSVHTSVSTQYTSCMCYWQAAAAYCALLLCTVGADTVIDSKHTVMLLHYAHQACSVYVYQQAFAVALYLLSLAVL
jgi:hypothetical protein